MIVILNARAGNVARSGNLQSMIAGLTDVLGALAAGLFWLVFCWTGFETLNWRRDSTRFHNL
jgi:hypothetical protein